MSKSAFKSLFKVFQKMPHTTDLFFILNKANAPRGPFLKYFQSKLLVKNINRNTLHYKYTRNTGTLNVRIFKISLITFFPLTMKGLWGVGAVIRLHHLQVHHSSMQLDSPQGFHFFFSLFFHQILKNSSSINQISGEYILP